MQINLSGSTHCPFTQKRARKRAELDGTDGIWRVCAKVFKDEYDCGIQLLVDDLKIATVQLLQPLVVILPN